MASSSAQTIEAALLRSTPPHRLRHSCSADQLLLLTRHCSQGDEGDRECLQSALYPLSCIDVSSCSAQQRRLPQDLRWKPGSKESERADQLEMRRQTLRLLLQQHSPAHPLLPLVMRSLSQQMMDCEATRSPQQQQLHHQQKASSKPADDDQDSEADGEVTSASSSSVTYDLLLSWLFPPPSPPVEASSPHLQQQHRSHSHHRQHQQQHRRTQSAKGRSLTCRVSQAHESPVSPLTLRRKTRDQKLPKLSWRTASVTFKRPAFSFRRESLPQPRKHSPSSQSRAAELPMPLVSRSGERSTPASDGRQQFVVSQETCKLLTRRSPDDVQTARTADPFVLEMMMDADCKSPGDKRSHHHHHHHPHDPMDHHVVSDIRSPLHDSRSDGNRLTSGQATAAAGEAIRDDASSSRLPQHEPQPVSLVQRQQLASSRFGCSSSTAAAAAVGDQLCSPSSVSPLQQQPQQRQQQHEQKHAGNLDVGSSISCGNSSSIHSSATSAEPLTPPTTAAAAPASRRASVDAAADAARDCGIHGGKRKTSFADELPPTVTESFVVISDS